MMGVEKRFQRYLTVPNSTFSENKVRLLLDTFGEEIDTENEQNQRDNIMEALDDSFLQKRNITFERFTFSSRHRKPEEDVDAYLRVSYELPDSRRFERLQNKQFVIGMADKQTSNIPLRNSPLTLEEAITTAKRAECQAVEVTVRHSATVNAIRGEKKD